MVMLETVLRLIQEGGGGLSSGFIMMFGSNTPPTGWVLCDGSAISRTTYSDLFAVIGTTFGAGDGSTTFNVPNMKTRLPRGKDTGDTLGATGGADTINIAHTHTVNSHTHSIPSHTHGVGSFWATVTGGTGAVYFDEDGTTGAWTAEQRVTGTYSAGSYSVSGGADVEGTSGATSNTSGGATPATDSQLSSTQNIQNKYINLNFIIKT